MQTNFVKTIGVRLKPRLGVGSAVLILCVAIVLFGLLVEKDWQKVQQPKAVAAAVAGFTLVESGFSGRAQPLFGAAYATRLPYGHVSYGGETFLPTRNRSIIVFPVDSKTNRYVVTEVLAKVDDDGSTKASRLSIVDTESGKEVASRTLKKGQIEDQTGGVGDHAARFVLTVLPPQPAVRAPFRYWNEVMEQSLISTRLLPNIEAKPFEFAAKNCPSGLEIKRRGYPGELAFETPNWRFVPNSPLSGAFCSDRYVVVVSDIFPNHPFVDVLRLDGSHIGTLELGVPGDLLTQGAGLGSIENGKIAGQVLTAELLYVKALKQDTGAFGWAAFQRTEVRVTIPEIE